MSIFLFIVLSTLLSFFGPKNSSVPPPPPPPPAPGSPSAPTIPNENEPEASTTSIMVFFNTAGQEGTEPVTYSLVYGTTQDPKTPFTNVFIEDGTNLYYNITDLTPNTGYYFKSVATNSISNASSNVSAIFRTLPVEPENLRENSKDSNSISILFNSNNQVGNQEVTYKLLWGLTDLPTTIVNVSALSQNEWSANITGLEPGTTYYFVARAYNRPDLNHGYSDTAPISVTTDGDPPVPVGPNAPGVPSALDASTINSISVQFDTSGQIGTQPVTYSVLYGTTTNPTNEVNAEVDTGTIYTANITGLDANTPYYFKSKAANSVDTARSPLSVPILTAPNAPSVPTSVSKTYSSITVEFDTTESQTGTGLLSYEVFYGTTQNPLIPAITTLKPGSTVIYECTVSGLDAVTDYYFISQASNSNGLTQSAVSLPIKTDSVPYYP